MLNRPLLKAVQSKIVRLISSRNALSAVWSSFDAIVYPILMLLVTPYFINKLGADLYGIWMLVNTVIASIGILNVGFGDATIKYVAQYEARNDRNGANKIIATTFSMYLVLCALVVAVAFGIAFLVKLNLIFTVVGNYSALAYTIIPIAGATLGAKFIEQIFLAAFKGYSRYDVSAKISIVVKVITIVTNVIMLYLGYSLLAIFVASLIIAVVFLVVEGYMVYYFFGFNSFIPRFEKQYMKEVFSFGIWTWSLSILGLVSSQIDKYLVITLADIKTFAFYSIAVTIFNQIHNLFSSSVSWVFPFISNKIHNNEDILPFYRKAQWMFISFACLSLTVFFAFKGPFLLLWMGPDTYEKTWRFVDLFICFNFIMSGTILPFYFLNGSGYFKLNTFINLLSVIARLVFIPLMYRLMNTEGLVWGLILSGLVIIPFQMNFFSSQILKQKSLWNGVKFIFPFCLYLLVLETSNTYFIFLIMFAVLLYLIYLFKPHEKL